MLSTVGSSCSTAVLQLSAGCSAWLVMVVAVVVLVCTGSSNRADALVVLAVLVVLVAVVAGGVLHGCAGRTGCAGCTGCGGCPGNCCHNNLIFAPDSQLLGSPNFALLCYSPFWRVREGLA